MNEPPIQGGFLLSARTQGGLCRTDSTDFAGRKLEIQEYLKSLTHAGRIELKFSEVIDSHTRGRYIDMGIPITELFLPTRSRGRYQNHPRIIARYGAFDDSAMRLHGLN